LSPDPRPFAPVRVVRPFRGYPPSLSVPNFGCPSPFHRSPTCPVTAGSAVKILLRPFVPFCGNEFVSFPFPVPRFLVSWSRGQWSRGPLLRALWSQCPRVRSSRSPVVPWSVVPWSVVPWSRRGPVVSRPVAPCSAVRGPSVLDFGHPVSAPLPPILVVIILRAARPQPVSGRCPAGRTMSPDRVP